MRGRAGAATALIAALIVLLAVAGAGVWLVGAAAQRMREMATVALTAAVQRDVSIGSVSGDPWRGLVFEDVRLAPRPPEDAVPIQARRITVHLDLRAAVAGVLGRRGVGPSVAASISQIVVDDPVLRLMRDEAGAWSVGRLLPPQPTGAAPAGFAGRIIILNGTVLFTDRHHVAPRVFAARFADVNGTAEFSAGRLTLRAAFVEERGNQRTAGRATGAYLLDRQLLDLDLDISGVDAAAWGSYLLATPTFRITGGVADGQVHLLRAPTGSAVDFSGRLVVRDGAASFPGRPASVSRVSGEIRFSNRLISTPGLRGVLNGSWVDVRGEVSFHGEPRMDIAARSGAASLSALGRLFFPALVPRLSGTVRGEVRITGTASTPRIQGRIDHAAGQFDRQDFEQASADVAMYGGLFSLTGGRGRVAGARIAGDGLWTLGEPDYFLSVDVQGAEASLVRRWVPADVPAFDGRVSGTLVAAQRPAGLGVAGHASLAGGRVGGASLESFDASFRYDPSGLAVDYVRVRSGDMKASATGRLGSDGRLHLDILARVPRVDALPLPPRLGEVSGWVDVAGRVSGTMAAPELRGFAQAGDVRVAGLSFNSASSPFIARTDGVRLDGARARSGYARYGASGDIAWGGAGRLALDLDAGRVPIADLSRLSGAEVSATGLLDAHVRLEGSLASPLAGGSLAARDAAAFGQAIDEARAAFQWDGRRLVIAGASARRDDSVVRLAGTFDRVSGFNLDLLAQDVDVRDLALPPIGPTRIDGRVDAIGRITGPLASPAVTIEAASSSMRINFLRFDRVAGAMRWEGRTLTFDPLALRVNGEQYDLRGSVVLGADPTLSLVSTVADGRLSTLLGLAGTRLGIPFDGIITGTASLDGPIANPRARLDLALSSGRLGTMPASGRVDLSLAEGSVTIQDLEFSIDRGRIAATGRYDLGGTSQIEVSGAELPVDVLRPLLRLRRPLLGRMDFTVQLGGTLAAPDLGLDLEVTRGGVEGAVFDSLVAAAFYREGLLELVQGLLVQDGHKLRASGTMPFNPKALRFDDHAPLNFRLTLADVNLGLLRLFTDRIAEARGAVEGALTLTGTVEAPRLSGSLRVDDGSIRLRDVLTPIEAIALAVRVDENAARITEGSARAGGGQVRLEGAMRFNLAPAAGPWIDIRPETPLVLQASPMHVQAPPLLDARIEGALRVWGTLGDRARPATLEGRIAVSEGTVGTAVTLPSGNGEARFPLVFQRLSLEVGRDLAVRVGDARVVLQPQGVLVLTGTLAAPQLEGALQAQRGAIVALGNTFDLQEGVATFRPALGVRPQVSGRAVTRVGRNVITLAVRGVAPDALSLDLESDPPLQQSEIAVLLGQQAGLTHLLTGDITALLRAEITRRLFAPVTLAIGRALGLSELTIEYDFEQPLRLRAGRLLLRDLYLTVTTTFAEIQQWWWALEYRFAPGWQLALQLDPQGRAQAIIWYATRF